MMTRNEIAERILLDFLFATDEFLAGNLSREEAELIVYEAMEAARGLLFPMRPTFIQTAYLN
jgi:hypothetical protein